jgi:steroid delta-isomerase-like uncharacterized protein
MPSSSIHSPVRRILNDAFNEGNLDVVDEVVSSDHFVHKSSGGAQNGPQGFKGMIAMYRTGFPDLHCTIEEEIWEDDKTMIRWTMCGTHRGLFLGNLPTGKQMLTQGIIFARFEKAKILEFWMMIDNFDLLQQLGIIPR